MALVLAQFAVGFTKEIHIRTLLASAWKLDKNVLNYRHSALIPIMRLKPISVAIKPKGNFRTLH